MHFSKKPFNSITIDVELDGDEKEIEFQDTQSHDEVTKTRSKFYEKANVFLICFELVMSITGRVEDIHDKWYREIRLHSQAPIILVGTHHDLRDKKNSLDTRQGHPNNIISTEKGNSLGAKIKAVKYLECSLKTGVGIDDILEEAVNAGSMFKPEIKPELPLKKSTYVKPVKPCPSNVSSRYRI